MLVKLNEQARFCVPFLKHFYLIVSFDPHNNPGRWYEPIPALQKWAQERAKLGSEKS